MATSRDYPGSLRALNNLQSNASTIESWIAQRRTNPNIDLKPEMVHHLESLGIDLSKLSVIHVAGTKGKGSVCAVTESILRRSGHRTGLYTSPHLVSVRERIAIDGKPISPELFAKYFWETWDQLEAAKTSQYPDLPSYFRFLTLMAFKVFQKEKVDVSVIETGVGGRTDATNVVLPVVTGITPIGYDHMNVLGNTLSEIAFEKSGIFKRGVPAFTTPQTEEAMKMLKSRAIELIGDEPSLVQVSPVSPDVILGLAGDHQRTNAGLALALSQTWKRKTSGTELKEEDVKEGLKMATWPGRGETIKLPKVPITLRLDGAHTPESMEACSQWFREVSAKSPATKVLVFNCNTNRDPKTLLQVFSGGKNPFQKIYFCSNSTNRDKILQDKRPGKFPENSGKTWQEEISETWKTLKSPSDVDGTVVEDIPTMIEQLESLTREVGEIEVLITGSLYQVGGWEEIVKPNMCDA